ncbi:response regulator with CheY-like receiver domain and winged-helix DNA-binding domain [Herbaspirillum sp. CF444]|uniref:response regulator transcription factor n=1 Tax=Herbaspirillum sp. CF444 TaxID=1144319 RepID=UPI0002724595|nr:winged helix-turn-helix domain-containing protein [Herbaspirillum sp. CF444]EJL92619.1 response regulator with CheY-like receiver domain and winged-helix DNA-binding domain [Herbaspirillum sp. CF444]
MDAQPVNGMRLSSIANLRQQFPQLGIVAMVEKSNEQSQVNALHDGADHFLHKPVNLSILSATVVALFRRLHIHVESLKEKIQVWRFNRRSQILSGPSGVRIVFSDRESAILTMLFLSPHFPVSTERLLHSLNMSTDIFDPHRVDTIIYRIRKKLSFRQDCSFEIRNVYGKGYMCVGSEGEAVFYVWDGR